jgi:TRAP-type mannitol/chloroaromatic compound transport system substrate-binding protein
MTSEHSRRRFITVAAAGSTLAVPTIATAQTKVRWRAQTMWSAAESTHKAFEDFCKRVAAATGGRLEIQPFAAGTVVGAFESLDAVGAGVLDAQSSAPVYWSGKDAGFAVIGDLNFAYEHPWQIEAWYYHRGGLELLREAYAKYNVYPVGVSWWGLEALVSKKPVKTTDDFKGVKIRTPQGIFAEIMTKYGASVVVVPGGEVYSALDKGVVDMADWATESMNFRMGFFEVAKTSIRIGHSMPTQEFAVNAAKWRALPDDIKAIVSSCVREWTWDQVQRVAVEDTQAVANIRSKGGTAGTMPAAEIAKMRTLAQKTWEEWSRKTPLAKKAYDSQIEWVKALALVA